MSVQLWYLDIRDTGMDILITVINLLYLVRPLALDF
jgi:hypothetical protein